MWRFLRLIQQEVLLVTIYLSPAILKMVLVRYLLGVRQVIISLNLISRVKYPIPIIFRLRMLLVMLSPLVLTITQPSSALQAGAVSGIISNVGGSTNVVVNATGGTPPYTGTGTFNNVSAGTYNYSVSDASGCTVVTSVTIAPGSGSPSFTASANASYISCFGGTTTVTVNAAGGVAPYSGTGSFIRDAGRGSLKISFPAPVAGAKTYIYYPIGAISSSKNYILRLTTLGTTSKR